MQPKSQASYEIARIMSKLLERKISLGSKKEIIVDKRRVKYVQFCHRIFS